MFERQLDTRSSIQKISRPGYNLIIGGCLIWGLVLNALMVEAINPEVFSAIKPGYFLAGYLALGFGGIYMNQTSKNPLISFIGFNLVVVPIGAVLVMVLPNYNPEHIAQAIFATASITGLMMLAAMMFPEQAKSMGKFLSFALLAYIAVQIAMYFMGFKSDLMAYVGALIFSLYIAYDWARAQSLAITADNAVDAACALYLDIINLFLKLLEILGDKE